MAIAHRPSALTSGLIRLAGNLIARGSKGDGRVCVINYHRILAAPDPFLSAEPDLDTFRWQMRLLSRCFNVLPLHEAMVALRERIVPERAVCITFDDGYRSLHDLALPVLREYKLPATVFVTTGYLDSSIMWNDRILEAMRKMTNPELDLSDMGFGVHPLSNADERSRAAWSLVAAMKYLPPDDRLTMVSRLETLAGGAPASGLMLTREMVASMSRQDIEIGGHTVTHPILTSLDDASAFHEIAESKRQLEEIVGKSIRLFAYPNGKVGVDYDARHVEMVKQAGYAAAFTTAAGAAASRTDPYQIPRCRPWDSTPTMFALRLLHWLRTDTF